jgi:hypothetical protein
MSSRLSERNPGYSRSPSRPEHIRQGHALVQRYIRLHENEGWPPEGFSGSSQAEGIARRLLSALGKLGMQLWNALPETGSITVRACMRRTSDAAPLDQRHLALRLGRCRGWFKVDASAGTLRRGYR